MQGLYKLFANGNCTNICLRLLRLHPDRIGIRDMVCFQGHLKSRCRHEWLQLETQVTAASRHHRVMAPNAAQIPQSINSKA